MCILGALGFGGVHWNGLGLGRVYRVEGFGV